MHWWWRRSIRPRRWQNYRSSQCHCRNPKRRRRSRCGWSSRPPSHLPPASETEQVWVGVGILVLQHAGDVHRTRLIGIRDGTLDLRAQVLPACTRCGAIQRGRKTVLKTPGADRRTRGTGNRIERGCDIDAASNGQDYFLASTGRFVSDGASRHGGQGRAGCRAARRYLCVIVVDPDAARNATRGVQWNCDDMAVGRDPADYCSDAARYRSSFPPLARKRRKILAIPRSSVAETGPDTGRFGKGRRGSAVR